jgi:dihydropteroate synthase
MTKIMGILNVTPDSFYDGGCHDSVGSALQKAKELEKDGADLIDIGGESTRPFSDPVSIDEELRRVIPVIQEVKKSVSTPLSIDTRNFKVAQKAFDAGACFINDVSGFSDPSMCELAASTGACICVMHMKGDPKTMQENPVYEQEICETLLQFFDKKKVLLTKYGVKEENILFDPGIGFGKTVEDNTKIIHNLQKFKVAGFPILLGLSRKSFMGKIVGKKADALLAPTIAMNTIAMLSDVNMIRVHDVKEHRDVIEVLKYNNVHKLFSVSSSWN